MRTAWMVACALLFLSVAGFAAPAPSAPLSSEALAEILGQPAVSGPCAGQPSEVSFVVLPTHLSQSALEKALCTATAHCQSGTVSCTSNTSTTSCSAADRNCSIAERGHVTCDGVTTLCPTPCSPCEICAATGSCFYCCKCEGGTNCARSCIEF
jgi:hypothetical protein